MEFGKIRDPGEVDWRLPPEDPANRAVLENLPAGSAARVFVGCPIWQDDALARKLCPSGLPKSRRLACYAGQFNALELNATGYGIDPEKARQWAAETGAGFRFCPKVPRDISHAPDLGEAGDRYRRYAEAARHFGDRLGPSLLQFPESFGPGKFLGLERFLDLHAHLIPLAVEVRHRDWFAQPGPRRDLFDLLKAHGVMAVITDAPGRRDVLHQRLTASGTFVRFNALAFAGIAGPDERRLHAWAERIKSWLDQGIGSVYFFAHADPPDLSADLDALFLAALNRLTGLRLPAPRIRSGAEAAGNAPNPQLDLFAP